MNSSFSTVKPVYNDHQGVLIGSRCKTLMFCINISSSIFQIVVVINRWSLKLIKRFSKNVNTCQQTLVTVCIQPQIILRLVNNDRTTENRFFSLENCRSGNFNRKFGFPIFVGENVAEVADMTNLGNVRTVELLKSIARS